MAALELLTTRETAERLGVSTTSVKRWADEGVLAHVRTLGDHRRFRLQDVEHLRLTLSQASAQPFDEDIFSKNLWLSLLSPEPDARSVALQILDERSRRGSYAAVADRFGELLRSVGERWQKGRLSIREEHAISAAIERGLTILKEQTLVPSAGPRCLLATAEGDDHALGLHLAELVIKEAGYRTVWAGRATPVEELEDAIVREDFRMIALSASSWSRDKKRLAAIAKQLGARASEHGVTLVLGGTGAWPEHTAGAHRLHSFDELARFLRER